MKKLISIALMAAFFLSFSTLKATALEDLLVSKLGIENEQAAAGVGIVLNYLKSTLTKDEYKTVSEDIGDEAYYIKEAESADAFKENKTLSKYGKNIQNTKAPGLLGSTSDYFNNIGIKSDKVSGFFNTILQYLEDKGAEESLNILSKIKI